MRHPTPPSIDPTTSGAARQWIWPLLGLVLIGYGLLAFNSGTTLSPVTSRTDNGAEVTSYILKQTNQGIDMTGTEEVRQAMPAWVNLMARLSSGDYAYGDDGLQETEVYYFSMSETRRTVLSTHMMLGLVLMTAGFLQFWPAFRRRFRKAHRVVGVVYVLAAFASMTLSGIHLVNSGIANTYNTFVFHVGLWIMLVGVVVSVSMAGLALLRKDIARHMGWQALGFGFLMTAPLQRIDWLALSTIAGDASFNEMNILVNTILFVQASLAGYWLFRVNRSSSPLRASATLALAPLSLATQRIGYVLLAALALVWLTPAMTLNSLADMPVVSRMIPAAPLSWLSAVVDGGVLVLFALALEVLMLAAWTELASLRNGINERSMATHLTSISAVIVAAISLHWAYQLGMPNHSRSLAGGGFALLGLLLIFFMLQKTRAQRQGARGKAVEWLQFLLLSATSPALILINLWLLDVTSAVPPLYLAEGAGYELATIGAVFTPVLIGFLLSVYSAETERYRIS
ncbi:DUF2306 domain-containing protein [Alcanivorax sp. 1008]|uniref:DUF2306 domain-containing protein n=1 Tax=Alcanivorax sp. 1008 TaxID=2816853 RepID=UPI001D43CE4E|nr:DUF2306 domain-containing protein [Alcanivorax sp. 1008]MCC1497843.1 DUF2306 domain-containing protein [Alcanivorax sp. 1008]